MFREDVAPTTPKEVLSALRALVRGDRDPIACLANASALLAQFVPGINWVGWYLVRQDELVLGPFQGKPACTRIARGRGVCGTAWAEEEARIVADVTAFPGHIACDAASRSEVVVPLRVAGRVVGVLDCDAPVPGRFTPEDRSLLEGAAAIVGEWLSEVGAAF